MIGRAKKTMRLVVWTAASIALVATTRADSSAIATLLDMSFEGELTTTGGWSPENQIKDQLLYTIGSLNASNSVSRLDKVVLTNVRQISLGGGRYRVTYHAQVPVAWGSKTNLPTSFTFTLPRDVSFEGLEAFAATYQHTCVDFGAHDVDAGSMWYYYRPSAPGCVLAEADITRITASAAVSPLNTTGKFPEYNKVWEDGELRVIAIFGKYEDGATTGDAGISAYNEFLRASRSRLLSAGSWYETVPANVPSSPGTSMPIVEQRNQLADGKRVAVFAFLVDNPRMAGMAFDSRYETLSGRADLIVYNGHAGLGANVRALARKGSWIAGQYVMVFMNGSDTVAYLDSSLFDRHVDINSDDPIGTKYTDVVVNAMPAYFSSQSGATMALINGLLSYDVPRTYEQIFNQVHSAQVVMVTGEGDNTFVPEAGGVVLPIRVQSSVAKSEEKRVSTPPLAAGSYVVTLAHDPAAPGGDADLYVRIGTNPSTSAYDCRPYKSGSDENCRITLAAPARLFTMVRGYANQSNAYILTIAAEGAAPGEDAVTRVIQR
jgi:hypothetical protein